jgi:hypothetical protein
VRRRHKRLLCLILGFVPLILFTLMILVLPDGGPAKWIPLVIGGLIVGNLFRFTWAGIKIFDEFLRRWWLKRHPPLTDYGITPPCCRHCGYDLRASPDHCPECGNATDRLDGTIIRYLMSLRRRDSIDPTGSPQASANQITQLLSHRR